MIKQLLYKWFGLEPETCNTCEILRFQLDESNRERKELLQQLLDRNKPEPFTPPDEEELKPLLPHRVPWAARRQMLEAEDREKARVLAQKAREIAEANAKADPKIEQLENELSIN